MRRNPPDPCPTHGRSLPRPGTTGSSCGECRRFERERRSHVAYLGAAGKYIPLVDAEPAYRHATALRTAGMHVSAIARVSGVRRSDLAHLLCDWKAGYTIREDAAAAILGTHLDLDANKLVDGTGTRRRLDALELAGYSPTAVARILGNSHGGNVARWGSGGRQVFCHIADKVAAIYPELVDIPGPDRTCITLARRKGKSPARFWTDTTIDDPTFDPLAPDPQPFHTVRRLRALARAGWGEHTLAAVSGEEPSVIRRWTRDKNAVPVYARPIAERLYTAHARWLGPDQGTSDHARGRAWRSFYDWEGTDIDYIEAQPSVFLPAARPPADIIVANACLGVIPAVELTHAERLAAVHRLHTRGTSPARIAAILRWAPVPASADTITAVTADLPARDLPTGASSVEASPVRASSVGALSAAASGGS